MIKIIIIIAVVFGCLWIIGQLLPFWLRKKPNPFKEFVRDVDDFFYFYADPKQERVVFFERFKFLREKCPKVAEMIEKKFFDSIFD